MPYPCWTFNYTVQVTKDWGGTSLFLWVSIIGICCSLSWNHSFTPMKMLFDVICHRFVLKPFIYSYENVVWCYMWQVCPEIVHLLLWKCCLMLYVTGLSWNRSFTPMKMLFDVICDRFVLKSFIYSYENVVWCLSHRFVLKSFIYSYENVVWCFMSQVCPETVHLLLWKCCLMLCVTGLSWNRSFTPMKMLFDVLCHRFVLKPFIYSYENVVWCFMSQVCPETVHLLLWKCCHRLWARCINHTKWQQNNSIG